jgi:hypothetical protein
VMLGSQEKMPDLQEKLRRFRLNWIADAADALADPGQVLGFKFNADDTPRFWDGDLAAFRRAAQIDIPPRDLPRFANVATHDEDQLAA